MPAVVKPVSTAVDGSSSGPVTWRTPLRNTAPYWEGETSSNVSLRTILTDAGSMTGWFKGLSSSFLSVRTARLLVLAGTERLDKELMIGQMQGKFQLSVVPETGHMIHEVGV